MNDDRKRHKERKIPHTPACPCLPAGNDRVPDEHRLGDVGAGWAVAQTTLMNERVAIGGGIAPREGGMIGILARTWREHPELRTAGMRDALLRLWVETEAARLTVERLRHPAHLYADIVVHFFFGSVHQLSTWYHPAGSLNPRAVSEYYVGLLLKGLRRTRT